MKDKKSLVVITSEDHNKGLRSIFGRKNDFFGQFFHVSAARFNFGRKKGKDLALARIKLQSISDFEQSRYRALFRGESAKNFLNFQRLKTVYHKMKRNVHTQLLSSSIWKCLSNDNI